MNCVDSGRDAALFAALKIWNKKKMYEFFSIIQELVEGSVKKKA